MLSTSRHFNKRRRSQSPEKPVNKKQDTFKSFATSEASQSTATGVVPVDNSLDEEYENRPPNARPILDNHLQQSPSVLPSTSALSTEDVLSFSAASSDPHDAKDDQHFKNEEAITFCRSRAEFTDFSFESASPLPLPEVSDAWSVDREEEDIAGSDDRIMECLNDQLRSSLTLSENSDEKSSLIQPTFDWCHCFADYLDDDTSLYDDGTDAFADEPSSGSANYVAVPYNVGLDWEE